MSQSRRDFLKLSAAGIAALSPGVRALGSPIAPRGEINIRMTAGTRRFASQTAIKWLAGVAGSGETIVLDPTRPVVF